MAETVNPEMAEAVREVYETGVLDGMEAAFQMILGQPTEGGVPYEGPLNSQAWQWLTTRLEAVRETKRDEEKRRLGATDA